MEQSVADDRPADPLIVGRTSSIAPRAWHERALASTPIGTKDAASMARRQYHREWLACLDAPDNRLRLPRVSILIPVFNRAAVVVEAIESCLAQTYPAVEIVVIDDGSTDDLETALAPYRGRITLVTQPNLGVSAARNAGARAAGGAFLHFLDSDNLLMPECIARKVEAFKAIPDAQLCFSLFEERDAGGSPCTLTRTCRPDGGFRCPTTELMRAVAPRHPFIVSTVMMPRWLFLSVGGFEEDLRRYHEDTRLWFRLGVRGTKTIALDERLAVKRHRHDGLSRRWLAGERDATGEVVALRCAADVVATPHRWEFADDYFERALTRAALAVGDAAVEGARAHLQDVFQASARADAGLSALPMLMGCLLRLRAAGPTLRLAGASGDALSGLESALRAAISAAPALSAADVARWRRADPGPERTNPVAALLAACAALARDQTASDRISTIDAVIRDAAQRRSSARWYAFAWLAKPLGLPRAAALSRSLAGLGAIAEGSEKLRFAAPRGRRVLRALLAPRSALSARRPKSDRRA